jgi:hypothetical protein
LLCVAALITSYVVSILLFVPDIERSHLAELNDIGLIMIGECEWEYSVRSGWTSTIVEFSASRQWNDVMSTPAVPHWFAMHLPCDQSGTWNDFFYVGGFEVASGWPFRAVTHRFVGRTL